MKDFFDIWNISKSFQLKGDHLLQAISSTFNKRDLPYEVEPIVFTPEFRENHQKKIQWAAFLRKSFGVEMIIDVDVVVKSIQEFINPVYKAMLNQDKYMKLWHSDGYWEQ